MPLRKGWVQAGSTTATSAAVATGQIQETCTKNILGLIPSISPPAPPPALAALHLKKKAASSQRLIKEEKPRLWQSCQKYSYQRSACYPGTRLWWSWMPASDWLCCRAPNESQTQNETLKTPARSWGNHSKPNHQQQLAILTSGRFEKTPPARKLGEKGLSRGKSTASTRS